MDLDGSNKEKIEFNAMEDIDWFCVYKECIYYYSSEEWQKMTKLNFSDNSIVEIELGLENIYPNISFDSFNTQDNFIIYRNMTTTERIFKKLNLDTFEITSMGDKDTSYVALTSVTALYIVGDKIVYYQNNDLYMMDLDGKNQQLME